MRFLFCCKLEKKVEFIAGRKTQFCKKLATFLCGFVWRICKILARKEGFLCKFFGKTQLPLHGVASCISLPSQPQNKVATVDFCLAMWYNAQKGVCPSVAKGNVSNAQGGAK